DPCRPAGSVGSRRAPGPDIADAGTGAVRRSAQAPQPRDRAAVPLGRQAGAWPGSRREPGRRHDPCGHTPGSASSTTHLVAVLDTAWGVNGAPQSRATSDEVGTSRYAAVQPYHGRGVALRPRVRAAAGHEGTWRFVDGNLVSSGDAGCQ